MSIFVRKCVLCWCPSVWAGTSLSTGRQQILNFIPMRLKGADAFGQENDVAIDAGAPGVTSGFIRIVAGVAPKGEEPFVSVSSVIRRTCGSASWAGSDGFSQFRVTRHFRSGGGRKDVRNLRMVLRQVCSSVLISDKPCVWKFRVVAPHIFPFPVAAV